MRHSFIPIIPVFFYNHGFQYLYIKKVLGGKLINVMNVKYKILQRKLKLKYCNKSVCQI